MSLGAVCRGEVRWYRFSAPERRRPALVLTRGSALEYLHDATVAPITATVRGIPTEVVLGPADGLERECAVNLDHVQTVPAARLGARLTALGEGRMAEVRSALLFALGWDE